MTANSRSKVFFFFQNINTSLSNRNKLKKFIEGIFEKEGIKLQSLNYIFCNDERLLKINRKYLNRNYYTDVITFDLSEKNKGISGEVYISVDRVKYNARKVKTTINSEIHRVIFHGALHLCGYNDKKRSEQISMRKTEEALLQKYL